MLSEPDFVISFHAIKVVIVWLHGLRLIVQDYEDGNL